MTIALSPTKKQTQAQYVFNHSFLKINGANKIALCCELEISCEQHPLGEELDRQHRELWLRERELVGLLREEPDDYELMQLELELIQQQMTEINNRLYSFEEYQ